jgi:hypothetical protein
MTPSQVKEPQINFLNKFDGMCSKFQGFLNQVQLVISLHPDCYPNNLAQVGFIGTLL